MRKRELERLLLRVVAEALGVAPPPNRRAAARRIVDISDYRRRRDRGRRDAA